MPPNGRGPAGSAESTSIPVADPAASEDMGISAPVSGGSIAMSSGARGGGGGGAEVVGERCEGAAACIRDLAAGMFGGALAEAAPETRIGGKSLSKSGAAGLRLE